MHLYGLWSVGRGVAKMIKIIITSFKLGNIKSLYHILPMVEMSRILEVVCLLLGYELQNYGSIQKSPLVTGQYIHVAMEKLHSYSVP